MSNTVEVPPEMNHYDKEIVEMKSDIKDLKKEVSELKNTTIRHDEQISAINKTMGNIEENTTWIKRKITGAIITAIISGTIGGAIAIFYVAIQN
ncbi:protein xhlA [Rossellomorea vietnamensis]|uniref:Protein xhlA n=1 Tax=Rossellomorea vietnamensis TaxID=218284 RepID=A0A5D4MBQ7_9BACI|nr:hemolysin XhlA family protein [Rossellomorea vietnamensis]TYR99066.1 protein xhlA [Rossellomorea vietnamensis]